MSEASSPIIVLHAGTSHEDWRAPLAAAAGCSVDALDLRVGDHGKPWLANDATLQFSRSVARGYWMLGIARGVPIGVDLERVRLPKNVDAMLAKHFPHERAFVVEAPESERAERFTRIWCAKEAIVKQIGRGIAYGLARIALGFGARGAITGAEETISGERWFMHEAMHDAFRYAVAASTPFSIHEPRQRSER